MRNTNRLIDDFKRLTKNTVWKHLDAMAVNYAVYSTPLNQLFPLLKDFDVYLYCNDTNMVVVCLESCGRGKAQTYEESETLSSLIFSPGCEPRVSVVWKLAETVRQIEKCLHDAHKSINVHGVLLTEADITNSYELSKMWAAENITVIDCLKRLKHKLIKVNIDCDLACKTYIDTLLDASLNNIDEPADPKPRNATNSGISLFDFDYEEFEKTVRDFIKRESDGIAEENEVEEQQQQSTDECEEECAEEEDEETPSTDQTIFPDGEIEQNLNVSVKVEILRPIPNPREELDRLVGCTDIKQRMDDLVALTSYNKMMHEMFPNNRQHEVSLHSVFLGRPGTGKTTVCKIFGSLLRQAGALSKGHVVVCDRGTFLGTLWGDEERSVRQVLEMARGGVLMIDEAYLLNGNHDHDPGKIVIPLLMNILADESQRDIAVVLCGYKEPMMKLLDSNPGLYSRFPNKFEFTDFTVDELLEITRRRIKDYGYTFTVQAWEKYSNMLAQAHQMRDPETWGNARFVANQLERIYIQHATRCVRLHPQDKGELLMLTPEDVLPIEIPRQKTKIGF